MKLLCSKCRTMKPDSEFKFNIKTGNYAHQCLSCQIKAKKSGKSKLDREVKKLKKLNNPH